MRLIKVLSLFSGIGAPEKALKRLGIPYELVGFCEIDKYAVQSYCAIHNVDPSLNLGDIVNIDVSKLPKDIDLVTHGSPCQDYSVAGKGAGGDKDSGTRSSLMWYTVELVRTTRPKYVLWENVKNILSAAHKHNFEKYLNDLKEIGYDNYHKVINAKDFNVPQSRERLYVISIRKDLNQSFLFPNSIPSYLRLRDILERVVDEKYYISQEKTDKLLADNKHKLDLPRQCVEKLINNESTLVLPTISCDRVEKQQNGRRFKDNDDPSFTLTGIDRHGILMVELQDTVLVRKYPVDVDKLSKTLILAKKKRGCSSNDIAQALEQPLTMVQHWFRSDSSFSIPGADIWYKLKALLDIATDEFDESITTFEEKDNNYDSSNRLYSPDGVSPTLRSSAIDKVLVEDPQRLGGIFDDAKGKHQAGSVWDADKLCPTLDTMQGGWRQPCIIESVQQGILVSNQAEVLHKQVDTANTLLARDWKGFGNQPMNAVLEASLSTGGSLEFVGAIGDKDIVGDTKNLSRNAAPGNRVYDANGIACTQSANGGGLGGCTGLYAINYRIRKLTPRECFRLMDFDDEDFDKASKCCSNTQLYKQAGNSIVVGVLVAIFRNLLL